jgi:hypothetical protein
VLAACGGGGGGGGGGLVASGGAGPKEPAKNPDAPPVPPAAAPQFAVGGNAGTADSAQPVSHDENSTDSIVNVVVDGATPATTDLAGLSVIDVDGSSTATITIDTGYKDHALFELATVGGQRVLQWKAAPDYETLDSSDDTKVFEVRLNVVDDAGDTDSVIYRITLNNVLDETPTFTLPTGLTMTAGETAFADDEIKRLSATTTETAGSAADRVVEFQESPTNGHANVEIAQGGALTLTGTPAAGTISVNWQWKYAGQPGTAWQDGAAFDITVNAAPQPVQPSQPAGPALSDFNQVDGRGTQGTRGSSLELLSGTGARDLFFIDTVATGEGGSDLVRGFVQSKAARLDGLGDNAQILGDILRFRDDSAPADATAINLYTALLDSSGSGDDANDLYIYETQGNTNAVLAIMLDVGTGFVLTNDDVWEDATIVAFEV